jgi:hypothetical protein
MYLRAQLARDNVRLVLLNGRQVLNHVLATGLVTPEEVGVIPFNDSRCRLYAGDGSGVRWVGWSTNLQSSFGVSAAFRHRLAERLSELCQPTPDARSADSDQPGAYLPPGTRVSGKRELLELLATWLLQSPAPTIGDVGSFGGRPWLHIDVGPHAIALNADTKRTAVETFVQVNHPDPDQPWRVIANRRGRVNKVLPYPGSDPLPGWYAYLSPPLPAEGTI